VLDRLDPVAGRYTLEVSSPGLERHLRTPEHFARAVGETVSVRLRPGAAESRRVRGHLQSADEAGIVLSGPDVPGGRLVVAYDQVERARTVFEWGPSGGPRPGSSKPGPAAGRGTPARAGREPNSAAQTKRRITTP
jgi:ribosome maturation factor RimP